MIAIVLLSGIGLSEFLLNNSLNLLHLCYFGVQILHINFMLSNLTRKNLIINILDA